MLDQRDARLDEPHVRPLMDFIATIRARGLAVPNVDPADGGVRARALFLLETPGPRAVGTFYVSRDNPDPSARNMKFVLGYVGFARSEGLLWNVVPQCLSDRETNRNATAAQIREAAPDTQAFIDALPSLSVIVFCGRSAQRARKHLHFRQEVVVLETFHPGAQAYNHRRLRKHIQKTFEITRQAVLAQGGLETNIR